jgi:hypothetical protein
MSAYAPKMRVPLLRALAFRESGEDAQAVALVRDAWSANEHVPAILAGTKPPVISDDGYVTMGGRTRRHGMRPGLASHARCGRVAEKTRRHLDAETANPCDYALIPLSVQF